MTLFKRLIFLIMLLSISFSVVSGQKYIKATTRQDSIVNYAESFLGTPYIYGGCTPKGFDCSGFVYFVFNHFQTYVPRSSADYLAFGKKVPVDSCQKGDIILFTGTNYDHSIVGHVGIIISKKGEPMRFIHSSSSKNHWGITITDYSNSGYTKRFMGVRRP